MKQSQSSRVLTVFAAGFLLLDGVLFFLIGVWARRPWLIVWGVLFALGAVGVVAYWRYHLRRLSELREALQASALELHRLQQDIERNNK